MVNCLTRLPRTRKPSQSTLYLEHTPILVGFSGLPIFQKPGHHGQPGSYEEALNGAYLNHKIRVKLMNIFPKYYYSDWRFDYVGSSFSTALRNPLVLLIQLFKVDLEQKLEKKSSDRCCMGLCVFQQNVFGFIFQFFQKFYNMIHHLL